MTMARQLAGGVTPCPVPDTVKVGDTRRESTAGAVAGCGASHKTDSLVTHLSRHGAAIIYTACYGEFLFHIHIITFNRT